MKFINRLGVAFYMVVLLFLGSIAGLIAAGVVEPQKALSLCAYLVSRPDGQIACAIVSGVLLGLNYIFWRSLTGSDMREKTIAFDNPAGRVSVSLPALEDLIRRVISDVPEVKDVRIALKAAKKSLTVRARLALNADVNIPEMSSNLQNLVRRKVQDTIGIEDPVTVRIDVSKIAPGARRPKVKVEEEKKSEPAIPFEGYRA